MAANKLFINTDGKGSTFTDGTAAAGVGSTGAGQGMNYGDVNGDGKVDLLVASWAGANELYENNGKGHFTDVANVAGAKDTIVGQGVAFGDVNNDG